MQDRISMLDSQVQELKNIRKKNNKSDNVKRMQR